MVFNMKSFILFIIVLCLAFLVGCGGQGDKTTTEIITTTESEAVTMNQSLGYEQITGAEAKMLMDTEGDYIIIDARTNEEFNEGHIEGAILIPEYEIGDVDLNGIVNVNDATLIQYYAVSIKELSDYQLSLADVNGDGVVNVLDATQIQRILVDLA